jgi:acyl-homoserine-lactone acylase
MTRLKTLALLMASAASLAAAAPAQAADAAARLKMRAQRVTITRDDWGIAHIRGKTDADAVFGAAYAQAEDDFNRVETNFITALGRTAEAEGEKAIWLDLRMKLFIDPADLKADYAASPAWLKSLMDAWADGLNHYLATHPDVKPKVITHFEPWMALSFSEGSIGGDIEEVSLTQLESFYGTRQVAMTADEKGYVFKEPMGSNGFAIAPKITKDGHAILWINPHTSFFFRSELQMQSDEGLNAYGAVTWGQFFIYQGFNAKAGWMHTSSGVDAVDEFAEDVIDQGGKFFYRFGDDSRPVTVKTIEVPYKTADGSMAKKTFTTYATQHGPVVRQADGKWIAVSLMNTPMKALQQSFLRTKATDYASYMKVAQLKANSSNNTLFASSKGEIAYLHPQFIPRRDDRFDYTKPVDGSDPATAWQGLHELNEAPTMKNPPNGWLMNVNDWPYSMAGLDSPKIADFPKYMDTEGETPRGVHAIRVLNNRTDFTPQGVIDAAFDPFLPGFQRLIPTLSSAYDHASDADRIALAEPIALLRGWDLKWSKESTATSLAVFWAEALFEKVAPAARANGVKPFEWMATLATDAERIEALKSAAARLTADFGSWKTPWGEINRFQRLTGDIVQPFRDDGASIPVAFTSSQWGSLASFAARRWPGTKKYYGTSGNSFVAAVEFGPRVKARAVTAGGESGHPGDKHFNDQAMRYSTGDLRPVYFYPDELKGHIERVYKPGN